MSLSAIFIASALSDGSREDGASAKAVRFVDEAAIHYGPVCYMEGVLFLCRQAFICWSLVLAAEAVTCERG